VSTFQFILFIVDLNFSLSIMIILVNNFIEERRRKRGKEIFCNILYQNSCDRYKICFFGISILNLKIFDKILEKKPNNKQIFHYCCLHILKIAIYSYK